MEQLDVFCRQVRACSNEHRQAIPLMYQAKIFSQVMSILRQEVDSMIRVIYLLTISDMKYREKLIKMSVEGQKWTAKDSKRKITDHEMVEAADSLTGWT